MPRMRGALYLIAIPFDAEQAHQHGFDAVRAATGRKPRVAYVGAANGDDPDRADMMADLLAPFDVDMQIVKTSSPGDDIDAARAQLEQADVIYFGGGWTKPLVDLFRAHKLEGVLRARHEAGATIMGVSAGAVAMTSIGIEADEDQHYPCFGLVDLVIDVHDEENDWAKLRKLLGMLAKERGSTQSGLGLPHGSAILVDGNGKQSNISLEPVRIEDR
jgi:peptidase E